MPTCRDNQRRARCRARGQEGAVAVEFALILPILIMLLLGITTTGISYAHALGLTNAVREGARFGAIADATSGSWSSDVATRVAGTQFDDPSNQTTICVELYKQGGGGGLAATCPASGGPSISSTDYPAIPADVPNGQCVVRVVTARTFTINIAVVPVITRTMIRGAVARYEGETCP